MTMYEIILDIIEKNGPISFSSICTEINQIHPIKNERTHPVDISHIKAVVNRKKDLFSVENDIVSIRKDMDFLSLFLKLSTCEDPSYTIFVDFTKNRFYVFEWSFPSSGTEWRPRTLQIGSVEQFKKEIFRLKLWNWKRDYQPDSFILDGIIWSVKLKTKGVTYQSKGLEKFPKEWKKFMNAVSRLTGLTFP